ncbi:MAG: matrixin family metalloprotease [Polyangiaceae bacterium]
MPPAQIVSGRAQVRYTEDGYPQRWGKPKLELTVESSLTQIAPDAALAVSRAVSAWQAQPELPRIRVLGGDARAQRTEEDDTEAPRLEAADLVPDGKNTVSYRRLNLPGHKKDLAITVAYADPRTGELVEADIFVNARRDFALLNESPEHSPSCAAERPSNQCGSVYDLQSVLTHELGHFLGLGEDVDDPLSTMFECTSACETHKRQLSVPDKGSAAELYLAESPEDATNVGCSVQRQRAQFPFRGLLFGGFALLMLWRRKTR